MQQRLTKACTSVINIASNCLEADRSTKIVESRVLVIKAADAVTIMGKLSTMLTNERKTRLKPALSESYQSLCDQDFSQSIYFFEDDLPEELRKAKSQHFLDALISKRQKTGLPSLKKRPSTSSESLNPGPKEKLFRTTVLTIETESTELTP